MTDLQVATVRLDEPKGDNWLAGLRSQPRLRPSWMLPDTAEWSPVWRDERTQFIVARPKRRFRYLYRGRHHKPAPTWRDRFAAFGDWCYRTFIEIRVGE